MNLPAEELESQAGTPGGYASILIAADSSDHANRGILEGVALARAFGARVTGTHAYAAKMHDTRFRQMEGGLPEQYRVEQELEHQREVHDDLITRGLSIITDSYLDQVEKHCRPQDIEFHRASLEGKNYRALVNEANRGDYDLMILGAVGVGAIEGSRIGTVCDRVTRRLDIDALVIREPARPLSEGPILVALDGSRKAYGGLLTAFALGRLWQVPIHVVAAFDPYYHYVAFNKIAGVLSEEAGKVFKFKEQEKLHEDIIDSGLARIYQGHLDVAESIAADHGIEITTRLLDGKAHDAIERHCTALNPSLLVIGKLGIHADPELDIGGNAENLLRNAHCAVLLSQREHQPQIDKIAAATTSWTVEAEQRMEKVPEFVQSMARMAILRYAQERGHTVITARLVEEATAKLMPGHAESAMQQIVEAADAGELKTTLTEQPMQWDESASALLDTITDPSLRTNVRGRAEKKARSAGSHRVRAEHIRGFVQEPQPEAGLHWRADALARLARVPEGFMREAARQRIEAYCREQGIEEINLDTAEAGLAHARAAMAEQVRSGQRPAPKTAGKCPFAGVTLERDNNRQDPLPWSRSAIARLQHIPEGYSRDMTVTAIEAIAGRMGRQRIDKAFVEETLAAFRRGAEKAGETLSWSDHARAAIARAPELVRGMLIQEIETLARRQGLDRVDAELVGQARHYWRDSGRFHLDPEDPRNT